MFARFRTFRTMRLDQGEWLCHPWALLLVCFLASTSRLYGSEAAEGHARRLADSLPPRPLHDSIVVREHRPEDPEVLVLGERELQKLHEVALPALLARQRGVNVREGRSGESLVSINGSLPRHVRILLNGLPLATSLDGGVNLRQIPLDAVQEIRITRGAAAFATGPGALGGVIDILTAIPGRLRQPEAAVQSGSGSWGKQDVQGHLAFHALPILRQVTIDAEQEEAHDDFPFHYQAQPSPKSYDGSRTNNDHLSRLYAVGADLSGCHLNLNSFEFDRGLPDRASAPNLFARLHEARWTGGLTWNAALSAARSLQVATSYQSNRQHLIDTLSVPVSARFNTRSRDQLASASFLLRQRYNRALSSELEFTAAREWYQQRRDNSVSEMKLDLNRVNAGVRATLTLATELPRWCYLNSLTLGLSGRYDVLSSWVRHADSAPPPGEDRISPSATLQLRHHGSFSPFVTLAAGRNWSAPSLTSLFWVREARSEGNPLLRPERAKNGQVSVGANWNSASFEAEIQASWQTTRYFDLIIWRPDFRGVFRPVNLAAARISGRTDHALIRVGGDAIELEYTNELLHTSNLTDGNDYDRELTFRPRYTTRLSGTARFAGIDLGLAHDIVGRRFATESNTRWYDAYTVTDAAAGVTVHRGDLAIRFGGRVRNLFDRDYAEIAHFPMPGRAWELSLSLTLKPSAQNNAKNK